MVMPITVNMYKRKYSSYVNTLRLFAFVILIILYIVALADESLVTFEND